jgi:hypothetical protein
MSTATPGATSTTTEPAGTTMRSLAAIQIARVNELNQHITVLEEHSHQLLIQKPRNEALCKALSSAIWALRMDAHSDQRRVDDMHAIADALDSAAAAGPWAKTEAERTWAGALREVFVPEGGAA